MKFSKDIFFIHTLGARSSTSDKSLTELIESNVLPLCSTLMRKVVLWRYFNSKMSEKKSQSNFLGPDLSIKQNK